MESQFLVKNTTEIMPKHLTILHICAIMEENPIIVIGYSTSLTQSGDGLKGGINMSALGKFVGLLVGQPVEEPAPAPASASAQVPVKSVKLKFAKYDRSMLKKWIVMLAWYGRHQESGPKFTDAMWEKVVQAARERKKEDIEFPVLFEPTQDFHKWSYEYDHRNRDESISWDKWYELSPYEREMYTPAIHLSIKGENESTVYDVSYDRFHKTDPNFAQRFHAAFWKLAEPLLDMKLDKNQVDFTDSVPEKIQGGNMPQTAIGDGELCEAVFRWKLSPADFAKLSSKKKKKLLKQLRRIEKLLHETIQSLVNAGDNEPKRESSPKKDDLDWFVEAIATLETEGTVSASFLKETEEKVESRLAINDGDRELTFLFFEASDKYETIVKKAEELRKAKKDESTPDPKLEPKDKKDVPVSDYTKYQGKGTIRTLSAWLKLAERMTAEGEDAGLVQLKAEIAASAYDGLPAEGGDACQMLAARSASGKCAINEPPRVLLAARDEDIKVLAAMSDGSGS